MNRAAWRRQLRSMPPDLRTVRGTLLLLSDVMTPDGILEQSRERLADLTGLPTRTLNRHLARAVDAGWLDHVVLGGNGRRSRYLAIDPSCRPSMAHNIKKLQAKSGAQLGGVAGHSLVPNSAEVAGHLVAHSIKIRASVSEHVALDQDRERRTDHNGARVSRSLGLLNEGSEDQPPARPVLVADSRRRGLLKAYAELNNCNACRLRAEQPNPQPCPNHTLESA